MPAERTSVLFYIFFEKLCRVSYNTRQICHVVCSPEMAAFFGREMRKTHGKRFDECPIKDTWQMSYLPADLCRELFAVCYTRQIFFLPCVFGHLPCALADGKQPVSGSDSMFVGESLQQTLLRSGLPIYDCDLQIAHACI